MIETSVMMACHSDQESTAPADVIPDCIVGSGAVLPGPWPREIANALGTAVRRHGINAVCRDASPGEPGYLLITIDAGTHACASSATPRLGGT